MEINNTKVKLGLLAALIFCLTLLVFWPGLNGAFLLDDYNNIVTNEKVQITTLTWDSLWRAANAYLDGTRQLAMVSFALNAYWAGVSPWAYKLTGLIVHAVNAALVLVLVYQLLQFTQIAKTARRQWVAAAVALVWALHPLQVSSALYVVQRMETLCYAFMILSLIFYLHARVKQIEQGKAHWGWWSAVLLSAVLALLSKESAVLLPLFTLVLEIFVLHFAGVTQRQRRFWQCSYGVGSFVALLVFVFLVVPHYASAELASGRDFNTSERLLTQLRVLVLYLYEIVLPIPNHMTFYYDDMVKSTGWLAPISTLWSGLLLLILFITAVMVRKRYPLAALGILWFFTAHFLTSNVVALEMVFEHRNYFALLGVLLVGVEAVLRIPVRNNSSLVCFVIGILVLIIASLGWMRAATWGNPFLLAVDMAKNNPDSARANNDLGLMYMRMSKNDPESPFFHSAARQFEVASRLHNSSSVSVVNLILMDAAVRDLPDQSKQEPLIDIEDVWQRYLQRLQSEPMRADNSGSLWKLLDSRLNGVVLDDDNLLRALSIILEHGNNLDYHYARAADYFLLVVDDRERASELYAHAVRLALASDNEELIGDLKTYFTNNNYYELIDEVNQIISGYSNIK